MAHPTLDVTTEGTCRVCGDRLPRVVAKQKGKRTFRRHVKNPACDETKGRGEPMPRPAATEEV